VTCRGGDSALQPIAVVRPAGSAALLSLAMCPQRLAGCFRGTQISGPVPAGASRVSGRVTGRSGAIANASRSVGARMTAVPVRELTLSTHSSRSRIESACPIPVQPTLPVRGGRLSLALLPIVSRAKRRLASVTTLNRLGCVRIGNSSHPATTCQWRATLTGNTIAHLRSSVPCDDIDFG
jgi:hypothetical protein